MPFDLIILGTLFVFILLLLGSVLGKRIGHEHRQGSDMNTGPDGGQESSAKARESYSEKPGSKDDGGADIYTLPGSAMAQGEGQDGTGVAASESTGAFLTRLKMAEPGFDLRQFQETAKTVFSLVLQAFANGDRVQLESLVDDDLYKEFDKMIADREAKEQVLDIELVGINEVLLKSVHRDGDLACLTLRIESEQSQALHDRDDKVIDGDPNQVISHIDLWTFAKVPGDSDPTWRLISIEKEEDAGDDEPVSGDSA